jgi:hypothetical protein
MAVGRPHAGVISRLGRKQCVRQFAADLELTAEPGFAKKASPSHAEADTRRRFEKSEARLTVNPHVFALFFPAWKAPK